MKTGWRKERGFSLAELIVASAVTAGMGLVFSVVVRTQTRAWQATQDQMTSSFELRQGIQAMARELAQAGSNQLWVPGVGGAWVVWASSDTASYSSVQFKVPEVAGGNTTVIDAAGAVTWSANPITYELVDVTGGGKALQREQTGAPLTPRTLAYGVTVLEFKRLAAPNNSIIEISVTVPQRGASTGDPAPVLSTRFRLRN